MPAVRAIVTPQRLVLAAVVVVAAIVRWQFVDFQTGDYRSFLDPWYRQIASGGGFAALKDSFSNYNTPYLALLAVLTYLPVPELIGIKAISVIFDVVLAGFAYGIVRQVRPGSRWLPVAGFAAVIMLPTVIMNGSVWAQCDAIYAAFCAGSLYFLMKRRPWLASAFFGLAFAFKLQAVFFLPVLVLVLIVNRQRIRSLLAVPVTFVAALVPALLAGRSLVSQLMVYPAQISGTSGNAVGGGQNAGGGRGFPNGGGGGGFPGGGGGRGGGGFSLTSGTSFTDNAPTPYAWLSANASDVFLYGGLALAGLVAVGFGIWLLSRRRQLSAGEVLLVAATATLLVPILLPNMHERYFYLAEVLTVLACFVDKRFIAVAAGIQVATITTYLAYLNGSYIVPLGVAAAIALAAAVLAAVLLVLRLRSSQNRQTAPAESSHVAATAGRDPELAGRHALAEQQA